MTLIFQTISHWLESAVNGLFTDTINFFLMPSDYVAIKTFIKCDPLLVQLLYHYIYEILGWRKYHEYCDLKNIWHRNKKIVGEEA